jgi:hypothetical protein
MENTASRSGSSKPLYRGTQVVWYVLTILEALLAFRFVLKLLGANAYAGFTSFIYGITGVFVAPFTAVFRSSQPLSGSVIEWTTLLAILVYWLIGWGIKRLFVMGKTVSTPEAAEKLSQQ